MMLETFSGTVNWFVSLPDYIAEGLLDLFSATVGGIFIAWVGSTFFARKSQIAENEGDILKRKVSIYEELSSKLEDLRDVMSFSSDKMQTLKKVLEEAGISNIDVTKRQILTFFTNPKSFRGNYLELDHYLVSRRIFFDENVLLPTIILQNYLGLIRRITVLYEEQILSVGVSLDDSKADSIETSLLMEIGILIQDEFSGIIDEVIEGIRLSLTNLNLKHHNDIPHTQDFFDDNGPIVMRLKETNIMKCHDNIEKLVGINLSMALLMLGKRR